jgi:hypothetical protein
MVLLDLSILLLLLYKLYHYNRQKLKLLLVVPAPAKELLAVFKPVGFDAQDVPSYSSVAPVTVGGA